MATKIFFKCLNGGAVFFGGLHDAFDCRPLYDNFIGPARSLGEPLGNVVLFAVGRLPADQTWNRSHQAIFREHQCVRKLRRTKPVGDARSMEPRSFTSKSVAYAAASILVGAECQRHWTKLHIDIMLTPFP